VPELPEVEVLCRSLGPLLKNKTVREVRVRRPKVLAPTRPRQLAKALVEGRFLEVSRRGKYLLFTVQTAAQAAPVLVVGHLGMTGRMYLRRAGMPLPGIPRWFWNWGASSSYLKIHVISDGSPWMRARSKGWDRSLWARTSRSSISRKR